MNKSLRPFFVLLVLSLASLPMLPPPALAATAPDANRLIEEFSFEIKDFKMDHQDQANNLNISVSYRYAANVTKADYPDFRLLAKDIETLLGNYPNKDDYWEIVNKNLTALLLKKYPSLASVTIELKVDPSRIVPYTRSSRVTRERPRIKLKHESK